MNVEAKIDVPREILQSRSSQCGFSLIELLIVVTVISIIAAIAITYLQQAREAAQGASAVGGLRVIHSSEISYRALYETYGDLPTLNRTGFINDPDLGAGLKSDYIYSLVLGDAILGDATRYYRSTATPALKPSDRKHFFIDATGIIRSELGALATRLSSPVD